MSLMAIVDIDVSASSAAADAGLVVAVAASVTLPAMNRTAEATKMERRMLMRD
jgi:hypothetical protein